MKFENIRVYNFENALRGMRNPKESWHLSDSEYGLATQGQYNDIISEYTSMNWDKRNDQLDFDDFDDYCKKVERDTCLYKNNSIVEYAIIGEKDLGLAKRLIRAGSEHRKFLREIFITVDITAPLYW